MNGNPVLTIQSNGSIQFKGTSPMAFQCYSVTQDYPEIDTGYSLNDWVAIIAGVNAQLSKGSMNGIRFLPEARGSSSNWILSCDVKGGPDDYWDIQALFIRREFVNPVNYYHD
jgi:hypothetical protein